VDVSPLDRQPATRSDQIIALVMRETMRRAPPPAKTGLAHRIRR
jgi:hypothetical protein